MDDPQVAAGGEAALDLTNHNSNKAQSSDKTLLLEHAETGEQIQIAVTPDGRSKYRFKCAASGLDRLASEKRLSVYFLTLTLRDEEIETANEDLNKFLTWMRTRFKRAGLPFYYLWTVELQRQRYVQTGQAYLHWHIAMAVPAYAMPNIVEKSERGRPTKIEEGGIVSFADLETFWGKGFVWSELAKSKSVYAYLSKYFLKAFARLGEFNPTWVNLRRFGSSQFGYYAFAKWAFEQVKNFISEGADLWFRKVRGGIRVLGKDRETGELEEVAFFKSPWRLIAVLGSVPSASGFE